ncbi:cytochrome c3 family protein [Candidatus Desantisbacteria bacterium]|nr:cytochrome c3 family protein [Candidatus Desantisbacteria bacterium]
MTKGKLVILLALVCGLLAITTISFAEQKNPETIVIEHVKDKRAAVTFEHKKHNTERKIECAECHHKTEKGKDVTEGCFKCHGKTDDEKDAKKVKLEKAFHKNCRDECHKTKKKGPVKCDECHPKAK